MKGHVGAAKGNSTLNGYQPVTVLMQKARQPHTDKHTANLEPPISLMSRSLDCSGKLEDQEV